MQTQKSDNIVKFTRIKSNKVDDITMGVDAVEAMTSMMNTELFDSKDEFFKQSFHYGLEMVIAGIKRDLNQSIQWDDQLV